MKQTLFLGEKAYCGVTKCMNTTQPGVGSRLWGHFVLFLSFKCRCHSFFPSSFTYTQEKQKHKDIMQTDFQKMGQTGLIYYSKLHTCRTHTRKKHDGELTVVSMLLFEVKCILSNGKFEKSKSSHMGSVRRNFIRNATPSILRLRLPACIEFCRCLI